MARDLYSPTYITPAYLTPVIQFTLVAFKMSEKRGVKRKRNVLTIQDKLDIIDRLERGEKAVNIAAEMNIGKTTVSDIKSQKEKLINFAVTMQTSKGTTGRKTMKPSSDEMRDKAIYAWFVQLRTKGVTISGPILKEKAIMFHEKLSGKTSFTASDGWLYKFKQRHGIRQLTLSGEKLSAPTHEINPFRQQLQAYVKERNLVPEQIYNADETGIYWKMIPNKTLACSSEKSAAGHKQQKERLTILGCTNATGGHKLKPLVIGKSKNPRCFKHVNMDRLPVKWTNQRSAWMDTVIFLDWFHQTFVKSVRAHLRKKKLQPKALLILDNCPAHPHARELSTRDGAITVMFLPKNVTALIQPADQGILETMKKIYRRKLLTTVLAEENDNKSLPNVLKSLTVKDAVYMIGEAWNEVKPETCEKSWTKSTLLVPVDAEGVSTDDETPLDQELENAHALVDLGESAGMQVEEIERWLDCDKDDDGFGELSEEDIVAKLSNDDETSCETDETPSPSLILHHDAIDIFDTLMEYLEQQNDSDPIQVMLLRQMRVQAMERRKQNMKQTEVREYFKRN